jgi:hypothetical protein
MTLDMKEIERSAYMTLSEDGLVDIVIGFVFLAWGILLVVGPVGLIGVLGPVAIGLWYLGKRFLTIPRIGMIKPNQKMETKMKGLSVLLLAFGAIALVGVLLLIFGGGGTRVTDHPLGILGLVIAAGVCMVAYLLNATRLYVYAVLLFIAFFIGENLAKNITTMDTFAVAVILASSLILLSGIVMLTRFLRKYPLPMMET